MKIEKTFVVNASQEEVWRFITSPASVAPCIPGCTGATQIDDTHYKATVGLAIGPIKTSFNVGIEQTEISPPEFARYEVKGDEGGQASRVKSESVLQVKALTPCSTEVYYRSDVTIVGRLGKFGAGLVQKKADSIGDEFVSALKAALEKETPASDGSALEKLTTDKSPSAVASISKPLFTFSRMMFLGLVIAAGYFIFVK